MKKYNLGYTTGVFDMFHIGHLNLIKACKEYCEQLIVGVTIDELVKYKNKKAVIPFDDRIQIVESIKYVDKVVAQENMDKLSAWEKLQFDVMFVGDDWKNTEVWLNFEKEFAKVGVDIVYLPYTKKISSSILREKISQND